ncbi:hypothetical protein, partial [Enterococcus sp. 3H8_DIV0648]|uniref:hypothetical protein n=2 Tax=Enterococcus TaxID=1350 RepID=UPI001C385AD7
VSPAYRFDSVAEFKSDISSSLVKYPVFAEVHDVGFRITNYSGGPVVYKVGINFAYGTSEGLEFELP